MKKIDDFKGKYASQAYKDFNSISLNNGYTDMITTNMFPDSLYIDQHPSILQRSL
jgi:hypothetical protein